MTKRLTLSILSFLVVIFATTGLHAQVCETAGPGPWAAPAPLPPPPPFMPHGPHAPGIPGLHHPVWGDLAAVGLDAKQKHALDGIRSSMKKSVIRKTADLLIARIELGEALGADTVDMKTVEEKVRTAAALQAAVELSVIRAIEEAKTLLTPAQKAKLKELHKAGGPHACPHAKSGKKSTPPPDKG